MIIYRPILPPKDGYVERDNQYFPTEMVQQVINAETALIQANQIAGIMFVLEAESETSRFDDVTIGEHCNYFILWDDEHGYTGKRGSIVRREIDGVTRLFKALHDIGSWDAMKKPEESPLYKEIGNPADEYPMWSQPISGVDNPYMIGDKVLHKEKHWVCDINNNYWEPGAYGWTEVKA